MKLHEVKNEFVARLESCGVDAPQLAACFVLEKVLGLSKFDQVLSAQMEVEQAKYDEAVCMIDRLAQHEPLAYVLGEQQFLDLMIHVEPGVLIPRSETEELADYAIHLLQESENSTPRVLDLCTGSGAIALAIKHGCPKADVTASDLSDDALRIASGNAQRLELDVKFVKSDLFQNIEGEFDMILSNPPYIRSLDCLELDRNVRDYEPMMALDGGRDGLDFYRAIAKCAPAHLKTDGYLMLEVGYDQSAEVMGLLRKDFHHVHCIYDMQNVSRMVIARKKGDA